jgi:hypothetical protein
VTDQLDSDTRYDIIIMGEPKIKHVLLLPLNYNPPQGSTGKGPPVPQGVIDEMLDEIYVFAGGYTVAGTVRGAYRMEDGSRQDDDSLQIWIGVYEEEIPDLKKIVAEFGKRLGQEQMYLERTGGTIDFVPPYTEGEGP